MSTINDPVVRRKDSPKLGRVRIQPTATALAFHSPQFQADIHFRVVNYTHVSLVTFNALGLPITIPAVRNAIERDVVIEITIKTNSVTDIDFNDARRLAPWIDADTWREIILHYNNTNNNPTELAYSRAITFHYALSYDDLERSPNGIFLEQLGLMVGLEKYKERMEMPKLWSETIEEQHTDGVKVSFNSHDPMTMYLWTPMGNKPIRLATNKCDLEQPEGLRIESEGTVEVFKLTELRINGYYTDFEACVAYIGLSPADKGKRYHEFRRYHDPTYTYEEDKKTPDKKPEPDKKAAEKKVWGILSVADVADILEKSTKIKAALSLLIPAVYAGFKWTVGRRHKDPA
jgi:hypothetical protein